MGPQEGRAPGLQTLGCLLFTEDALMHKHMFFVNMAMTIKMRAVFSSLLNPIETAKRFS